MSDEFFVSNPNPVFPCICGHLIIGHGEITETESNWEWDDDQKERVQVQSPYPRPVCWECGPGDCYFVEMTNLEFLEWKDANKCN